MASTEPEGAVKELESLQQYHVVYEGDKFKAFTEWAREHAERLYPDVGGRSYVVPPLFVHKHSTRYDHAAGAEVLQDYQRSSPKGEKAHCHVTRSFCLLSPQLQDPLFIISGLEYDNMLKWVRHHPHLSPHLPDAVENRGDIDIMTIHPHHGVVFIQVKAVGDNEESRTQTEIQKKITLGGKQLRKDDNILRWVLQDWQEAASCHATHVVALPNLTRHELASFWPPVDFDPGSEEARHMEGVVFLCKDNLPMPEDPAKPEADMDLTSLMTWWKDHVAKVTKTLSLPLMKDMVSRYVGMLSAVEVYAGNNLRKEVRLTSDAIDVCGMMFRRILLNEQQLRILMTPCRRRYLSGPPGSGKTVLLVLRARQFVRQGGHVIVVNMYRGAAGRAIGHFIRDSVARFRLHHEHETKRGKAKSKAKKKKGEERAPAEDTPQGGAKTHKTPPSPRKGNATPPTPRKTGGAQSPARADTPSVVKREQRHPSPCNVYNTPPSSRRTPVTPPSSAGRKDCSLSLPQGSGTPPSARKRVGTPPTSRKGLGTPPFSRKAQDSQLDMSDHVHSVDVDIDHSSFNSRDFETRIRLCLPRDIKTDNVMFVVDEIYVKEYWSDILDVLNASFAGCHIWCAGLYSRNPPTFEQEDLLYVLRCPPLVQKVLYAVDWDPNRRACYRLNTDCSGVYTPGLTPLSVRHQGHPQVSITECKLCAAQLSALLFQGLGLTLPHPAGSGHPSSASSFGQLSNTTAWSPHSSSPGGPGHHPAAGSSAQGSLPVRTVEELVPERSEQRSTGGSSPEPKLGGSSTQGSGSGGSRQPSTARGSGLQLGQERSSEGTHSGQYLERSASDSPGQSGESSPLRCSDVVILVNIPRALYEPDERGFLDTTKEDFMFYMAYLATCPLVSALRAAGVPVKVVQELPCCGLYRPQDGQVTVAWAYTYQGLENKVIIYLPGDTPWTPDTHSREIPAPGLCSSSREQPKVWRPVTVKHLTPVIPSDLVCPGDNGLKTGQEGQLMADLQHFSCQSGSIEHSATESKLGPACSCLDTGEGEEHSRMSAMTSDRSELPCAESSPTALEGKDSIKEQSSHLPEQQASESGKNVNVSTVTLERGQDRNSLAVTSSSGQNLKTNSTQDSATYAAASDVYGPGSKLESGSRSRTELGLGSGPESGGLNLSDYWWNEKDVQRYSNWDKSNLFVAGSRCLSQLIMLIP